MRFRQPTAWTMALPWEDSYSFHLAPFSYLIRSARRFLSHFSLIQTSLLSQRNINFLTKNIVWSDEKFSKNKAFFWNRFVVLGIRECLSITTPLLEHFPSHPLTLASSTTEHHSIAASPCKICSPSSVSRCELRMHRGAQSSAKCGLQLDTSWFVFRSNKIRHI